MTRMITRTTKTFLHNGPIESKSSHCTHQYFILLIRPRNWNVRPIFLDVPRFVTTVYRNVRRVRLLHGLDTKFSSLLRFDSFLSVGLPRIALRIESNIFGSTLCFLGSKRYTTIKDGPASFS